MYNNQHILIVRLSSIGDVLHCTPVARTLKEAYPTCHLTWVVGQGPAEVLQGNTDIDDLYIWPRERWEKAVRSRRWREAWQLWGELKTGLKARNIDIVLDVHGQFLSGMVAAASGAPRRIGLSHTRELNSLFMTEQAPLTSTDVHVIQYYLSILRPLGLEQTNYHMTLVPTPEAIKFADEFLYSQGIQAGEKIIAINPSTTWPAKNWPPEYFAAAAAKLQANGRILLCGGPGDRALADTIKAAVGAPIIDAVGQTSLQQMAALLARCHALLVGDTGPLHMALALDIPTVSIFGATPPERYGPLTPGHIVLTGKETCPPCHKHNCRHQDLRCLRSVTPDAAVNAIRQLI